MDRTNDSPRRTSPWRQLIPVALVLVLCLGLSGAVLYCGAQTHARQEALSTGQSLGRGTAILIQPLLLADDRISLNYLFNELSRQPQVRGLRLLDTNRIPVAVAGETEGTHQTLELARGDQVLGELTIWVDSRPGLSLLRRQLLEAGALALIAIIATLTTLWLILRRQTATPPETDFAHVAARFAPSLQDTPTPEKPETDESDSLPDFPPPHQTGIKNQPVEHATQSATDEDSSASSDDRVSDEDLELSDYALDDSQFENAPERSRLTETGAVSNTEQPDEANSPPDDWYTETEETNTAHTDERPAGSDHRAESQERDSGIEPHLESWLKAPADDELPDDAIPDSFNLDNDDDTETEEPATPAIQPAPVAESPERDDNRELVELLRPSRDQQRMPKFTPSAPRDEDSDEAIVPDMDQVEFDDGTPEPPEPPPRSDRPQLSVVSPLSDREEEQLGLYTLEHELELMLPAEDAGYLFLIDSSSAHSDNLEPEELSALMRPYRTLANSVAHIYSGRLEPTREGDLQLFFDDAQEDDSHGINALCSAMLFSYLYRHYNQSRIRQFKPVINLHLALVRGHREKLERLLEEARFLTRTTESNELISHTALTETPDLKSTLLDGADIRREDEDKVLIMRIAKSYQDLLEKQARHLLTKLQQKEQSNG
jgi:hypothetical protein